MGLAAPPPAPGSTGVPPPIVSSAAGQLTDAAAAAMYRAGLERAGARIQARHSMNLERAQYTAVQSFIEFLQLLPPSMGRNVLTATPEDVVVRSEVDSLADDWS